MHYHFNTQHQHVWTLCLIGYSHAEYVLLQLLKTLGGQGYLKIHIKPYMHNSVLSFTQLMKSQCLIP